MTWWTLNSGQRTKCPRWRRPRSCRPWRHAVNPRSEALYPIEQLITKAKVGQPDQTGGERTATPLCSGQGSTPAPSVTREQPRRKWQKPLTEECLKRLRTSTFFQTRTRTPRCPMLPAYVARRYKPKQISMAGAHGVCCKLDARCEPSCRTSGSASATQMRHLRASRERKRSSSWFSCCCCGRC